MGEGIIKRLLGSLRAAGDSIPDVRRGGNALRYRITDALMCAFAVFFFLYPSLLHFQRVMKIRRRRDNLGTLFGVSEIPWDNKIRELMDGIEPDALSGVFMENLWTAEEAGVLEEYRVLDGGVLIAIDGLWYHASQKVRCGHCQQITKDGETTYYHSAVAGAVVRPGSMRDGGICFSTRCMPPCAMSFTKPGGISSPLSDQKTTWNENENCCEAMRFLAFFYNSW